MDKKDKKLCMCIDYRALDKITIKNNYPLHQIDDLFNCLNGVSYFNQIDLKSSYYQIHVEKTNVKKMAMMVRYNFYEFLVMLLGLCNAPSTFTTLMKSIFHEKLDEFVIIYIWHFSVFQVYKRAHETFGVYVVEVQRKQIIHQLGQKWVCKFEDGLFGICVVPGRGEVRPKENWIHQGMANPSFSKKG